MSNSALSLRSAFGRISLTIRYLLHIPGRPGFAVAALSLFLAAILVAGYHLSSAEVQVVVNGRPWSVRTHQTTVQAVLRERGITLRPQDEVSPSPDAPVLAGDTITVSLARSVKVEADGQLHDLLTHRLKIAELLAQAGVTPGPRDRVLVDGQPQDLSADLSELTRAAAWDGSAYGPRQSTPDYVVLRRAIPIFLYDGEMPITIYTTSDTVGEALLERNVTLFLGDRVNPSLGSRVSSGMRVFVERAEPVSIQVDGQTIKTRTRQTTVADVLAGETIILTGQDYTRPALSTEVSYDMSIQVVRVREAVEVEQEEMPFETIWQADPALELDQQRLVQDGGPGLIKRRSRVVYEDGVEVSRELEDAWLDKESSTKVVAYGTRIVEHELDTADGKLTYWRKFRALVTSYTAADCGKEPGDPYYGVTSMGLKAGKGIVAVDSSVINMGSNIYVPGYGKGFVGDTGGQIVGRRVDLGYDEGDSSEIWYRWIDVYLLSPPPSKSEIRWVLPNWPQERRRG